MTAFNAASYAAQPLWLRAPVGLIMCLSAVLLWPLYLIYVAVSEHGKYIAQKLPPPHAETWWLIGVGVAGILLTEIGLVLLYDGYLKLGLAFLVLWALGALCTVAMGILAWYLNDN